MALAALSSHLRSSAPESCRILHLLDGLRLHADWCATRV